MGQIVISGTTYEIYGTEAGVADYLRATLADDAWSGAESSDKKKAQITAARWLNRQGWVGEKTSDAQPIAWPRTGVSGVDDATVPVDVISAEYELTLALLGSPTLDQKASTENNTKKVKAGSAEVEFFKQIDGFSLPTIAYELIKKYLQASAVTAAGLASGVDETSAFCPNDNKLSGGFA